MDSKSLMIGDWVRMHYPFDMDIDMRPERINVLTKGVDIDCEAIPLTAEILEKNGFSCVVTKGEIAPSIGNFQLDNHWQGEDFSWHQIPMLYVHTLQHALRLCGIDKEIVL